MFPGGPRPAMAGKNKITRGQYEMLAEFRYALRKFLRFSEDAAQAAVALHLERRLAQLFKHGSIPRFGRARRPATVRGPEARAGL